jgi:hypothetical protein
MLQASNIVNRESDESDKFIMLDTRKKHFSDDTFNFYLLPQPAFSNDIRDILELSEGWVFTNQDDFNKLQKMELTFSSVRKIPHLNSVDLQFLNPSTRDKALIYNYLIKL